MLTLSVLQDVSVAEAEIRAKFQSGQLAKVRASLGSY
jgi:hypothetical protein